MDPALFELYAEGSPDDEVAVILRLADPFLVPDGVRIVTRFGNIATCRLRRGDIQNVWGQTDVLSMKAPRLYGPGPEFEDDPNELLEVDDRSDLDPRPSDVRRPGGDLPTGHGVVIAHIDWGLDFAHPDFRHPDGRTRILALWDQSCPSDPRRPNRYGYGRIYDSADIDRALAAPHATDVYRALGYHPGPRPAHGTHTVGISAGNGRSGGPVGLAPEAGIVFAHLSTVTPEGPSLLAHSAPFIEALDFFVSVADGRPLVVNASVGRQAGQHDGLTLTEQAMDAFLLTAPGRALVQSCGNYFDRGVHATDVLRPGQLRTLRLDVQSGGILPNEIDLWYPGTDRFGVTLRGPEGVEDVNVAPGARAPVMAQGREIGRIHHRIGDPNNGDNEVALFLSPTAPTGRWEIVLFGNNVANGRFHAWVERTAARARTRTRFDEDDNDRSSTLGTICNGLRTIAVGAYDAHQPDRPLAPFSSAGPTRDFRELKPELMAPGVRVLAARSHAPEPDGDLPLQTRMSGSSMSSPHVAGTIALMFAAAGRPLSIDETRRLLLASSDPFSPDADQLERFRMGSGYLDTAAAVAAASEVGRASPAPNEENATTEAARNDMSSDQVSMTPDAEQATSETQDEGSLETRDPDAAEAQRTDGYRSRGAARSEPRGLPFQFQIPLTGGPPALALPIGGAASPFALTVPLGGTPAASPVGAPIAPVTAPPATTSELLPVTVAKGDIALNPPTDGSWEQEAMRDPGVWQELALQAEGGRTSRHASIGLAAKEAVALIEQAMNGAEALPIAEWVESGIVARANATPRPVPGSVPIDDGREVVAIVPLLRSHVGTPPDLVLRWNRMATAPDAVDVVVHLHGFSGHGAAMRLDAHKERLSGLDFVNPDAAGERGRTTPTLGILPRGNFYGGRTGMGYDFPSLVTRDGLRRLIDVGLGCFARRIGAHQVAMRRLLLTAHSGGGAALMRILGEYDADEVHVFDALYSDAAPLVRWLAARLSRADAASAALRVLYVSNTGTARQSQIVAQAIRAGLSRASAAADSVAHRFRVEATQVAHNDIPRRFGWRLLSDAGSDLPLSGQSPGAPSGHSSRVVHSDRAVPVAHASQPSLRPHPAPAGRLGQADVDRLSAITFGSAADIDAFFARTGSNGFADWFNAHLAGRAPFVRLGGGGAMRMPISADARQRFNAFWDCVELAYGRPRISALEFATLTCITLNETDGDFAARTESSGRGHGGRTDAHGRHPGLAYFFDRIELRPGRWKASYNRLSGGRPAGSLFNDEVFIRAHGARGGAAALAHKGTEFDGAWMSEYYPQDRFSVDERAVETEFVRQADFYKFRGRGIIQTTGRAGYLPFVRFILHYAGRDAALLERRQRWAGLSENDVATASTNEDWDAIFGSVETLAHALGFHANSAGTGRSDYRTMSSDLALLLDVPPAPPAGRTPSGRKGSIFFMGRRISGSYPYAAGEYRERVLAMLGAIAGHAPGTDTPPAPDLHSTSRGGATPQRPSHATPVQPVSTAHPEAPTTLDGTTLRAQWDAHPRVHAWFDNQFARYEELAPLYAPKHIPDAAAYLDANIVRLSFFGRHQDGHRDLAAPLREAEEAMRGQTVMPAITSFGCLVPRPIRGTTTRLSHHSLGRAFDLNPVGNPRITQASDYLVIAGVTGVDIRKETSPTILGRVSRAFQEGFTEAWVKSQTRPDIVAALSDRSARERLHRYARHGICTLYVPLVDALMRAGLVWGGTWHSSKDFMHFELHEANV